MQSQDVARRPAPSSPAGPVVEVEQAEAALVEHYPRLVRIAYLVLPSRMGRCRRVLTAHSLTQRALPRARTPAPAIPSRPAGRDGDPGYALVRLQVVRTALEAGLPLRRRAWPKRAQLPSPLPQVWGLKLFPRSGGADELALDQRLSALSGPARAACVLRGLERLPDGDVREVLTAAGVADADAALAEADRGGAEHRLLDSAEFDPCSLQARPTDLLRRRRRLNATLVAGAALAVCGALLGPPGDGWGPDGAAAPPYARNPAAQAALDPGRLTRVSPTAWRTSARVDFSVWPARGDLTDDTALLRRALAVWARPGGSVQVSATPGTPSGGPAGPPQLLYAGTVDNARVVILHDGLRIARYAEPADGTRGAALDFARVDGAGRAGSSAVVLGRTDGNVRYLTAPWVRGAGERDLREPGAAATDIALTGGVTPPLPSPALTSGPCTSWNVLQLTDGTGTRLVTDLGELVPAGLTAGRPGAAEAAAGAEALRTWAPFACSLRAVRSAGVRSVNAWAFAEQPLPDAGGSAAWVCTRAETWRGGGARVLAQFHTPGGRFGAVTARAEDVPACGAREPRVLAGVLWKSGAGTWYLLAAGSRDTVSVRATGGVEGSARGRLLTVRAEQGARADLKGTLEDGRTVSGLR
ncbi:hypothetical protein [Streptomyces griseomycini]|uniref:DNA-directed RNA polymerase specialized sigma24 family protein n=1 Tax=Streptomyces griseomycini TaxID=66895 RepID=A0A7W7LVD8_9ACTN|nr:hypothetical protein [Streptomyces griseomycini]MBB4896443.1 hypothetical protein [Streptomyces griseomycini]GGP84365.1 hypothetical protein GCM10010266_02980 [Streptomyces griseomycini]GGR02340.1 hypothetical protein GCM10015536_03980 [Streptomyces griseomycini]